MVTLKQINQATLDQTSSEDFDILLREYNKQHVVSQSSKDRFRELIVAAQQDAKRYNKQ